MDDDLNDLTRELAAARRVAYEVTDACVQAMLRLAEVSGRRVACKRGCNACCDCQVAATLAEAMPIALWLSSPEQKQRLDCFREQLRGMRDKLGGELAGYEEAIRAAEGSDPEGPERQRLRASARAYRSRRLFCPFNAGDAGCEIYPIRPLVCRAHWVADTSDYCEHGSRQEPLTIQHPTFTEACDLARGVLAGASAEAGFAGKKLLPEAVAQALALLATQV